MCARFTSALTRRQACHPARPTPAEPAHTSEADPPRPCPAAADVPGLMQPASHHRCHLGPGARKGLALVRGADAALGRLTDDQAVERLRADLRTRRTLGWVEAIDVEQALCEFSKYEAYATTGVSAGKRWVPPAARPEREA